MKKIITGNLQQMVKVNFGERSYFIIRISWSIQRLWQDILNFAGMRKSRNAFGWGLLVISMIWLALIFNSCYKDQFTTSASAKLRFSKDTLRFDTVFTTVGSATRSFKIFNDADLPIKIQRITLKNAGSSVFRFNVDGLPAFNKELLDIEIGAKDSIYIFLEVTIQPNQPLSISPFVIQDQVQFITNGNNQSVLLEAWGQNANYIPSRYSNGRLALLSCDLQTETWDDPKPYVIYGVLFIDSCTLRIPAGARVYVHGGLVRTKNSVYDDGIIYVLDHGKLLIEGNAQKPVTMASDRLETELKDEWGAWSGIRINTNSTGNRISYADIKSAYVGVYADSASDVTIRNSKIYNTASSGILGVHASVTVENCLTYNNGSHGIQFAYGGVYRVDYTTIASYENDKEGLSMNNLFLRDPERMLYSYYPLNAFITNCIITGSGSDELDLTDFNGGKEPKGFNTVFSNCYVKAKELLTDKNYPKFFNDCPGCIKANANDTIFLKPANYDFRLDTNAVVNNKAKAIDRVKIDLPGVIRDVVKPDMGCYELR